MWTLYDTLIPMSEDITVGDKVSEEQAKRRNRFSRLFKTIKGNEHAFHVIRSVLKRRTFGVKV